MSVKRTLVSDLKAVAKYPALGVWFLLLLSIPFYVLPSGLPQPGNVLIFFLLPLAFYGWNGRLPKVGSRPLKWLGWFTFWVCLVNIVWALILGEWAVSGDSFTVFPFYYLYNIIVFMVVLVMHQRFGDLFLRVTMHVLFIAVGIQCVASMFMLDATQLRNELFFNNPNQLGFWALLAASIIALCQRRLNTPKWLTSIMLLCCAYLAFVSASRAAVGGVGILFFLLLFSNPRLVVIGSLVVLGLVFAGGPVAEVLNATERRIEYRRDEQLSTGRGYDRMWTHKEHLALGAGEGAKYRFAENPDLVIEIHSSLGTVLFSYGVIGTLLFLAFLWNVISRTTLRTSLMLAPCLAYMVTHQGLRFSMLWVFLAMFVIVKRPRSAVGAESA